MKTLKKMSFNLAAKELSRGELRGIMAGSGSGGPGCPYHCYGGGSCGGSGLGDCTCVQTQGYYHCQRHG